MTGARRTFTSVAGGTVAGLDVALPRAAEIRGRTVDAAGRSVGRTGVVLKDDLSCDPFDDARPVASTTSDANGDYTFTRLPALTVAVCLGGNPSGPAATGYLARQITVTTAAGRVSRPVTTLREAGGMIGKLVDGDGNPVVGAAVQVFEPRSRFTGTAQSGADGTFRVRGLELGRLTWCVSADRFAGTCDASPAPAVTSRSGVFTDVGTVVLRQLS